MANSQVPNGIYPSTSYGSINDSFSQWNQPCTNNQTEDGYSEQQQRVCELDEDNFDYEDNFLYHTVSSRNSSAPAISSTEQTTGLIPGKEYATPYYSSATDMRSGTEHDNYDVEIPLQSNCDRKASSLLITWNLLNLLLGNGILALPFAVYKAGVIVFVVIVLVATITMYTGRVLIDCLYETQYFSNGKTSKVRVRQDYVELGQDAFDSAAGGILVHILQCIDMICTCILNLIVLGALCQEVFPSLDIKICTIIGAVFSLPSVVIRKIQWIAWMQLFGTLSLMIALVLIQVYCIVNASEWQPRTIPVYNLESMAVAIGIVIYSFSIHPVLPGIEQQMRHPQKYNFLVSSSFIAVCLLQYLFGFSNASLYGSNTKQLITVDLENHFSLGVASAVFVFISVVCCLSLPTFVIMERFDKGLSTVFPSFIRGSYRHFALSIGIRLLIIALSMAVAVLVPYFAYVMAFIGCSIKIVLSILLPCLFHLMVKSDSLSCCTYAIDIFVILFGIFSMTIGMYHAAVAAKSL